MRKKSEQSGVSEFPASADDRQVRAKWLSVSRTDVERQIRTDSVSVSFPKRQAFLATALISTVQEISQDGSRGEVPCADRVKG